MDEYKSANTMVASDCKTITEMLLVNIDGKRVYDSLEFEEEQVSWFRMLSLGLQMPRSLISKPLTIRTLETGQQSRREITVVPPWYTIAIMIEILHFDIVNIYILQWIRCSTIHSKSCPFYRSVLIKSLLLFGWERENLSKCSDIWQIV